MACSVCKKKAKTKAKTKAKKPAFKSHMMYDKKPGKVVKAENTTPYSAMQLNLNGLEVFFQ